MYIVKSYIIWILSLFLILFFAIQFIPNQKNFLGGGLTSYQQNPYLYSWANFDGEHYLSIAKNGYGNGEQAFFPLYPLLINILGNNIFVALLISHTSFLLALLGLYKLTKSKLVILLLLVFPTSFYFASVYTESLFLCLVVWSFYFLQRKKYFSGILLGSLSSLTRVIGIIPIGVLSYMAYSKYKWEDYLIFFHSAKSFGEQRSDHLILLPQVFYRYFFKIIPNLTWSYFPVVFTTLLEVVVALGFLYIIIISFRKIKLEYWLFLVFGYLVPTFSGSFSSLPRYALVLFPFYIFMANYLSKSKVKLFVFTAISAILQIISFSLFARGYWLS